MMLIKIFFREGTRSTDFIKLYFIKFSELGGQVEHDQDSVFVFAGKLRT
jgi:hypothetical protein